MVVDDEGLPPISVGKRRFVALQLHELRIHLRCLVSDPINQFRAQEHAYGDAENQYAEIAHFTSANSAIPGLFNSRKTSNAMLAVKIKYVSFAQAALA